MVLSRDRIYAMEIYIDRSLIGTMSPRSASCKLAVFNPTAIKILLVLQLHAPVTAEDIQQELENPTFQKTG